MLGTEMIFNQDIQELIDLVFKIFKMRELVKQILQQDERWYWKKLEIGSLAIPYFPWLHPKPGIRQEYIGRFSITDYADVLAIVVVPRVYRLKKNRRRKRSNFFLKFMLPETSYQEKRFPNPIAIYPFAIISQGERETTRREPSAKTIEALPIDFYSQDGWVVDKKKKKKLKSLKRSPLISWAKFSEEPYQPEKSPWRVQCAYLLAKSAQEYKEGREAILQALQEFYG